jgi:hypothetical protein
MDPTRDNPIIRFTTFWWGIGTFMIFALLLAVIWFFKGKPPVNLEDVVAKARYETRAKVDLAQAAELSQDAIKAAMPEVAKRLAATKPAPVEKPDQVIPDSPTAKKLAAATPPPPAAVTPAPAPPAGQAPPVSPPDAAPVELPPATPPAAGQDAPKP